MHRRRGAVFAGTVAIAALTLTAAPAAAGPSPTSLPAPEQAAQELPAGMLHALQRDLGLSQEQAEARVANEYRAGQLEPMLRDQLGSSWAGAWTEGETSELVVATNDRGETGVIEAAGARAELVEHSMAELESV
ncbi:S1 family peptidase, partial [Streptomyces sp. ACA25]|nr:S1 family peptidase [Streptomyces sp. ACA25]